MDTKDEKPTQTKLESLSARALVELYKAKKVSPVEVTKAVLKRIDNVNSYVAAFCLIDHDTALASAHESEKRWQEGKPLSDVDGVPTSIKDIFLTKGWPTLRGSQLIDPNPEHGWKVDAPVVARLREAGAVLIGKTTTPELAWKGVTDSSLTGITRNPWNTETTAGGSSGGSAAAVAWDMGPLSVGTDGGGSVRIPAAFTSTFALKPTRGRIPLYPASPFGTLAHAGPITRTAEDAALLMDVITKFDARDGLSMPTPQQSHRADFGKGVKGIRIALSTKMGYVKILDPEIEAAVLAAGKIFENLGAIVELVDPPIKEDPVEAFHEIWFAGAYEAMRALGQRKGVKVDPGLLEICEIGRNVSGKALIKAAILRGNMGTEMGIFHEKYDLLLTPTLPIPAFKAGLEVPEGWSSPRWTSWTPYTYPFNMTEQPAASVPFGLTKDGLPIGIQLVGARHNDALILRAAHAFEQKTGIMARPPEPLQ
jgi:aspartyl-tRNA(Asn)/glutamyl-tRNA(Gln) amidotransferase subunit A